MNTLNLTETEKKSSDNNDKYEPFKKLYTLEQRCADSKKMLDKFPDKIPVIVEKGHGSTLQNIDKHKYLLPSDYTIAQFINIIRKRIKLTSDEAIFVSVGNNYTPATSAVFPTIYKEYKDEDGFLYLKYSTESVFG